MRKTSVTKAIVVFSLVALYCILELFVFNQVQSADATTIPVSRGGLKDTVANPDGSYAATSGDPWIEFSGISKRVSSIRFEISNSRDRAVGRVYYSYSESPAYDDTKSQAFPIDKERRNVVVPVDDTKTLSSLRLDYTDTIRDKVTISPQITLTLGSGFHIKPERLLLFFGLFALAIYYLYGHGSVRIADIGAGMCRTASRAYAWLDGIKPGSVAIAVAVIFVIGVCLEINASSIGCWDSIVTEKGEGYSFPHLGNPLPIRSDEWMVTAPWVSAQVAAGFPLTNPNIGYSGQNMLITGTPVWHPALLFQPNNWGYLLLGYERGLSWYWMLQACLLFLSAYELIRLLSGGKSVIALVFAIVMVLGPPVQWWSGLIFIGYMQLGIIGFIHYFKSKAVASRLLWGWLTITGYGSLFFTLYPPFLIPAFFLSLCIIVPWFIKERLYARLSWIDALIIPAFVGGFLVVVFMFFRDMGDALKLTMNTVYPGRRVSAGGDTPWRYLTHIVANPFIRFTSPPFLNQSEISSFIPFFFPVLGYHLIKKRASVFSWTLLAFSSLCFIYMFLGFPAWLAKATLLSMVPGPRLFVVFGIAGVYLAALAVSQIADDRSRADLHREDDFLGTRLIQALFAVGIALFLVKASVGSDYAGYLGILPLLSALGFSLCFACLLFTRPHSFTFLALAASLFLGLGVNPVNIGAAPLTRNAIAREVRVLSGEGGGSALWVTTEGQVMAALLYANGAHTLGGIAYYPDMKFWKRIDPSGAHADLYNRYAHVSVTLGKDPPRITLLQGDSIVVSLDAGAIRDLGVTRVLTRKTKDDLLAIGLDAEELFRDEADGLKIFKLNSVRTIAP